MKDYFRTHAQLLQRFWLIPALAVVVTILLHGFLLNRTEEYPVETFDSGWMLLYNDEAVDTGTLSRFPTGQIHRGDVFFLTRTLPEKNDLPSAAIFFRNLHSVVRVFLDGEEIYSSGQEQYAAGRMVARLLCFVPLPHDHYGKRLDIEITAAKANAFYGLGPFFYGVEQDLFTHFLNDRQNAFYIAVFLCVFGIVQIFWLPLVLIDDRSNIRLMFSALTTLILGIYLMGYYNLFDLFTDVEGANTLLEYVSMYSIAGAMSGFIATVSEGRLRKLYIYFGLFDLAFVVMTVTLHCLNIVHIISFLLPSYAVNFLGATPFVVSTFSGWHRRRQTYFDKLEENANKVLVAGFLSYVAGSFTDAAIFTIVRITGGQEATVQVPFLTIGSLAYAVAVCMHYFLHGIVNLRTEATRQRLQDKAFHDPLTGLSNRGECEMVLERLGRERNRFLIVSMDLDNLKTVNDTFGHGEGDRMLKRFAQILQNAFEGCELVCRMGGDEFLVILTGDDCDTAEDRLKKMQRLVEEENEKEAGIHYSISFGTAGSGDGRLGRRAYDVYMLADARMYDMKRRHK